ncbi:DUF1576 domain-containing protein, partial [Clostridium sp.]|uniref:DUF1576 domain-containing protein n=1 Tax=Clostridium sp. TaxID=1506 RepID=UPI003F2CA7E4
LPLSMLVFAFFFNTPKEILEGMGAIKNSNDLLLTDYFVVGNIGAAMVNSALITLVNLYLLRKLDLRPNGIIISALFLLSGFAFMGKNLFNIWPFYLGGYIYCKYHRITYKNVIVINMLATALSPLTSTLVESISDNVLIAWILSAVISAFIGFIMPPISSHMLTAHSGYSIYNMGFAAGLVGIVVYSILSALGYDTPKNSGVMEEKQYMIRIFFVVFCLLLILIGYILNEKSFKGIKDIFKHSGRLVTDMIKHVGFGLSLVNMGLLGLMCLVYIILMGGVLNGPVIAAMLTVIGFGAFGKHFRNTIPIMIGVTLASFIMKGEVSTTTIIISALFGTSLAPIAGEFGIIPGILAGIMHFMLVLNIGDLHGGIMLYNNGLSAGIIATLFIPMMDAFKREKRNET